MNYTEAIAAIESGNTATKYAWRSAWPAGDYIYYNAPTIEKNSGTSIGAYTPTAEDQNATDWVDGGDKPPAKAKK